MKISDLREFVRLAQTLNFTQTAREFYVTQSVFSRHIARMEKELGVTLLSRSPRGVALTGAGTSFMKDAVRVLAAYDVALENIEAMREGVDEVLVVGYLYGASYKILAPAISSFQKEHPKAQLRLESIELGEVADVLADNSVDLVVTTCIPEVAFPDAEYHYDMLYPDPISVIVPKSHPLARKESVEVSDLKGQRLVTQPFITAADADVDVLGFLQSQRDGTYMRETQYDIASVQTIMDTGHYVAVTFTHIGRLLGDDFVCRKLPDDAAPDFEVGIAWKREKESPLVRDFARDLSECPELKRIRTEVASRR